MNWVDILIIGIFIFFVAEARRVGFWVILIDFISFLVSLLISLKFYPFLSDFFRNNFNISHSVSNAIGFLFISVISEWVMGILLAKALTRIPSKIKNNKIYNYFEILPALGETIILSAFFATLIIGLPVSPKIKTDISESKIGGYLVGETSGLESKLSEVFGGIVEDSLTYLTVKPGSHESINIPVAELKLSVDEKAENDMFKFVNEERKKASVKELTWRTELVPVARAHAKDMWTRKYFGHVSPEGADVGDRLQEAGIKYLVAGENLALSPTTSIAMRGLMNSEGHRENILSRDFNRMGIGVIDNGYYGKMFVQIFTN
jgi:uncharacterized protein YkwD